MELHRELFNNLPPAEILRKQYAGALAQELNADGYYVLVQYIAEQYGDQAYEIAEEVFKKMGLTFDPADLRTPDLVRRVGYNFEGINIYVIQVRPYAAGMAKELVRLYNQQLRKLGRAALVDEAYFKECIAAEEGGLLVACNEAGQPVGFVHCRVEGEGGATARSGSVEALVFSHGRIYDPVRKALVQSARDFFAARGVKTIQVFTGKIAYPFNAAVPEPRRDAFEQRLAHIAQALKEIEAG
jgi:hypothetical protein